MDTHSFELPFGGLALLTKSEHLHVMDASQASQQREQCRYYPVFSGSVDAARNHESNSHRADTLPERRWPRAHHTAGVRPDKDSASCEGT
jgi:hypothetical protein